jgi:type VI secretion system protein ImpA
MGFDPEKFLTPVDGAQPSGPNLEYDPDFQGLERAQQGKPEQAIGDRIKPAEPPDWAQVLERAQALLSRSRDLRIAVPLTEALLRTEGFAGLAAGLALVRGLLERQWNTLHPQLDADDDNDPTSRINSLLGLVSTEALLRAVRESPVVHSRTLGRFSLRDLRIASGTLKSAEGTQPEPPQQAQIDAAFLDADLEGLQEEATAVSAALDDVTAIDRLLIDKVGSQAPEFKPLVLDLSELRRVLTEKVTARGGAAGMPGGTNDAPAGSPGGAVVGSGEIRSREDVTRAIDRVCEYYRRHEPSSPLPLLLQRAKRLVSKDFLDIIRDLTPSGVAEAESIGGVEKSNQ